MNPPREQPLELRLPDLLRPTDVDEAHAGGEGAQQVRADQDVREPAQQHEPREHQEEVDLVARLDVGILLLGYLVEQPLEVWEDVDAQDDGEAEEGE